MTEMTRRNFLTVAGVAAASVAIGFPNISKAATPLVLAPLPYADTALAPVISQQTMGFHYGKHHLGYITNLNTALALPANAAYADMTLEQIMLATANQKALAGLFNNSAQALNHQFYWESMMPNGGDTAKPSGLLLSKIEAAFGDYPTMKTKLVDIAVAQFGGGWAWLVDNNGKLEILSTSNADNPKMFGLKPLLTIDVWEHAYYLDYQNVRKTHVQAVVDKLLNWNVAAARLGA
ncbi:MAG: superoxide dismutase [Methylococcaceae bacterium]